MTYSFTTNTPNTTVENQTSNYYLLSELSKFSVLSLFSVLTLYVCVYMYSILNCIYQSIPAINSINLNKDKSDFKFIGCEY